MDRLIRNQSELTRWVSEAKSNVDMAVAFWGEGAVELLGLDRPGRKFRILLDLLSGGTNPNVVRQLQKIAPDNVRCVRRLHTKMYLTYREVIVGSTNASANGLGSEGTESTRWHELALLSADRPVVLSAANWFEDQWARSEEIKPDLLKEAERAWLENRSRRPPPPSNGKSLIAAAIENPDSFMNRGWHVAIDLEPLDLDDQEHVEEFEAEIGRPVHAWTDWPGIPEHARIVSFTRFDGQRFKLDIQPGSPQGVYYSADQQRGRFKFVTGSHIPGFDRNVGGIREWLPSLLEAERRHKGWMADNGLCMDLGKFAAKYGRL